MYISTTRSDETRLQELQSMLMYRRPAGSKTERKFINRFIRPLGVNHDDCGNLIKRIGDVPVLWSCHTDTVHRSGGKQPVEMAGGVLALQFAKGSNCLGADDTAGVWLMAEMIRNNVPGLYVFHRGEEHGGIGSQFIAKKTPDLLKGIKFAIALDRKGTRDVITHQFRRCASDAFGDSLAGALNDRSGFEYERDSSGIFTDTANYTEIVPECTNISVGYYSQHSSKETQDGEHALALADMLCTLDTSKLVAERDPSVSDKDDWGSWGDCGYDRANGVWYKDGKGVWRWKETYATTTTNGRIAADKYTGGAVVPFSGGKRTNAAKWSDTFEDAEQAYGAGRNYDQSMLALIRDYPDEVADLLESLGVDAEGILEHIEYVKGFRPSTY